MYICLCHQLTDKGLKKLIKDGVKNLRDVQKQTGASTCCGTCKHAIIDSITKSTKV